MRLILTFNRLIFALLPMCAFLAACSPQDAPEQAAATPEEVFMESCGACHTREDNGPSVADLRALSPEQLRAGISNHPTAGDIPDRLTAARIDELIKYLEQ